MKVTVIKQYSIFMPNKPGTLSRLAESFAAAGVNMVGISSEVRDDSALVRIAVDGDLEHNDVLAKAGYASVEGKLLSVEVADEPGQLAKITGVLGKSGVNITTVYGTAMGPNSRILVGVEDTAKGLKLLEGES